MNRRSKSVQVRLALSVAFASLACVAGFAPPCAAQEKVSAGMEAYVDPATGRFIVPPAGTVAADAGGRAAAEIDVDAAEVHSPVVGGGMMMDLRGRPKAALTGQVTADGHSVVECAPEHSATAVQP